MLQGEHSAILSTFIKFPFVIKLILSIFEWPLQTGFTVVFKILGHLPDTITLEENWTYHNAI